LAPVTAVSFDDDETKGRKPRSKDGKLCSDGTRNRAEWKFQPPVIALDESMVP